MQRGPLKKFRWGWMLIAATWLMLFAIGFPLAFIDDLYFIGPAMNLAKGAGFASSYCSTMGVLDPNYASEFFVYMPLHGHVLALWLIIFGVSKWSLTFFQCLNGALATFGLERLMRPTLSGPISCLILSACVALFLSQCGMRPEALGLAFFCWGLLMLRSMTLVGWTLCSLSLFACVITSPNFGILIPLILGRAICTSFCQDDRRVFLQRLGSMIMSGLVIFLLLLYLIHFQLFQFLTIFNKTRILGLTAQTTLHGLYGFTDGGSKNMFRYESLTTFPYIALFLVLGVAYWRGNLFAGTISKTEVVLIELGAILLLFPANSSGVGVLMMSVYPLIVCLYFIARLKKYRAVGCGAYAVLFALLFHANGSLLAQTIGALIAPPATSPAAVLAELKQTPHVHVYIDNFALRSVFNYQVPSDGLDYSFSDPTVFMPPHEPANYPQDSVIVISRWSIGDKSGPSLHNLFPPVSAWLCLPTIAANPYDCVIVRGGRK